MPMPSPFESELRSLVDHPDENLATEIKAWKGLGERAVKGDIAKELIALANHGGGYLLFGFDETTADGWTPSVAAGTDLADAGVDLSHYTPDDINNLLKAHAEPVFECHTARITSSLGSEHVVIRVPGGHIVPIRSRGAPAGSRLQDHVYYIRRPGPESAPPDSAREWDELISRCVANNRERQIESFRRIIDVMRSAPDVAANLADLAHGADALVDWMQQSRDRLPEPEEWMDGTVYEHGAWSCGYRVSPCWRAAVLAEAARCDH